MGERTTFLQYAPDTLDEKWLNDFNMNFYVQGLDTFWVSECFAKSHGTKELCTFSTWEKLIKRSPDNKVFVYVIDSASLKQKFKKGNLSNNLNFTKYGFTLEEIERNNWDMTVKIDVRSDAKQSPL